MATQAAKNNLSTNNIDNNFFMKSANWTYPAVTFLSACLMFTLQPMFAKMLTPLMGGTPAVWNTALVFYQGTLLIGYFYAHIIATKFDLKQQLLIHGGLLLIGALFLPVRVTQLMGAPNVNIPVIWTFGALFLSIGAPIIAISATAPLVQAWRARIGDKVDPYPLYAASNLGSFLALAAYPFLIEPLMGAKMQSFVWAGVFGVLALLLFMAIRAVPLDSKPPVEVAEHKTNWQERLKWIGFAAPPSALLVAVTTHIVTDVASVPLLWIPPLALFLLTFVIAFGKLGDKIWEIAAPLKFLVVFILAATMAANVDDEYLGLAIHVFAFFLIVLCCHLELAHTRPEPARLTEFYLWMSVGGVLGGAFAALLAPVIFNTTIEYQIILAIALLIAPWEKMEMRWALPAAIIGVLAALWFVYREPIALSMDATFPIGAEAGKSFFWQNLRLVWDSQFAGAMLVALLAVAASFVTRSSILVATFGGLALLLPILHEDGEFIKFRDRSFFGVLEIEDSGNSFDAWRFLSNGTTLHGVMSLNPRRNREPMSYYWHETPIGLLYEEATEAKPTTLHAGVIGLGMGSTTCYAKPGQDWKVFEINQQVIDVSVNSDLVGFVKRCAPQTKVVLGDARLSMAKEANGWFDIVLVDAFTSDAIPTHMITQEAIAMMMSKIRPDGVLVVHISNRYLGLQNIVADGAHAGGFAVMEGSRDGNDANPNADTGVRAIILAHNEERLARYHGPVWTHMYPRPNPRPWTDDHTDIMTAIRDNY
ncbi:MAG: spermine/spermidine synthase [Hyphomonadaceae bacterium]|nr:MAG: spermine/spermidine synthase [Hyphomonadaceae bacterium]